MNELLSVSIMLLTGAGGVSYLRLRRWVYKRRLTRGYKILRAIRSLDESQGLAGATLGQIITRLEERGTTIIGPTLSFELRWLERCGNLRHWEQDGQAYFKLTSRGEAMCDLPY